MKIHNQYTSEDTRASHGHWNGAFSFDVGTSHCVRPLSLIHDKSAIGNLGQRCADYLRSAYEKSYKKTDPSALLLSILASSGQSPTQSHVLGIHPKVSCAGEGKVCLDGVLHFLRTPAGNDTWYILLLLLDPANRGRGLGTAVHQAFKRWAAARGAGRLLLAVSRTNPRAEHFWRDRLAYSENYSSKWEQSGDAEKYRRLEYYLSNIKVSPWQV